MKRTNWIKIILLISFSIFALNANADDLRDGNKFYRNGDYIRAEKSFLNAAEKGNQQAQYNLGLMYYKGRGVAQDYQSAEQWYRKAAEQGHADAQYNLGVMYYKGQGIARDYKMAAELCGNAAEQGNINAQNLLGLMYYKGQGLSQDNIEAHKWFNIAAARGLEDARRNRALVEKRMKRAKIIEAQHLASEWLKDHQK